MRQIKEIDWSEYPQTPEHFKETVLRTVKEQAVKETVMQTAKEQAVKGQAASENREKENIRDIDHEKRKVRSGKRHYIRKGFLIAAAVTVAGGAAIAANHSRLAQLLGGKGFSEAEVDALIETELLQESYAQTEDVYKRGEMIEKDWEEPLLAVTAAGFDGNMFYFEAKAGKEAQEYRLGIRDHAKINGYEGRNMGFWETEDSGTYLGCIELVNEEDASVVAVSDAAELTFTVLAQPKYEGILLCAWKDDKAYEKLFGKGAFTDENGNLYYVASEEEYFSGYTPVEISVQAPLDQSAKDVIQKYRAQAETYSGEEIISGMSGKAETGTESETGQSVDFEASIDAEITDDHVRCEIVGSEGTLSVDADIVKAQKEVYTGTLKVGTVPAEKMTALYEKGKPEDWTWTKDAESMSNNGVYKDNRVFVSESAAEAPLPLIQTGYESKETGENAARYWTGDGSEAEVQEAEEMCRAILESLGMDAAAEPLWYGSRNMGGLPSRYEFQLSSILEGLPVAADSQGSIGNGKLTLWDRQIESAFFGAQPQVKEKEAVEILDMEAILEAVADYAAAGELTVYPELGTVTEVELEYYVELTKKGLVFRPVWNFQTEYLHEEDRWAPSYDYFYIDAVTGALIRDVWSADMLSIG